MSVSPKRVVHLPFAFGEIVYHRCRTTKVPGMVVGFSLMERDMQILVKWGDDICVMQHWLYELTTEYQPDFSSES